MSCLASEAEGALGGGVDALLRALDIAPLACTNPQRKASKYQPLNTVICQKDFTGVQWGGRG
eukprot:9053792-Karenia_brevis.AAC.1